jgi:hypothetical protein
MVRFGFGGVVAFTLLLAGCSSTEWVHPTKPKGNFALDWNQCNQDILKDPKLQQGNTLLLQQATERCVLKKGWVLKEVQ